MSAYIVDNETITIIANAFTSYGVDFAADDFKPDNFYLILVDKTVKMIGQSLLNQNYKSVNARYNEETNAPAFSPVSLPHSTLTNPAIIWGCLKCYEYQACETDNYFTSDLHLSLDRLKKAIAERTIEKHYGAIPWGYIPEEPTPEPEPEPMPEPTPEPEPETSAKDYEIIENSEFKSLEIYFKAKPSEEIRNGLKSLRFRWHAKKHCWYGYKSSAEVLAVLDPAPAGLLS